MLYFESLIQLAVDFSFIPPFVYSFPAIFLRSDALSLSCVNCLWFRLKLWSLIPKNCPDRVFKLLNFEQTNPFEISHFYPLRCFHFPLFFSPLMLFSMPCTNFLRFRLKIWSFIPRSDPDRGFKLLNFEQKYPFLNFTGTCHKWLIFYGLLQLRTYPPIW